MASINQTGAGIRLPSFCNLGVMLRSLVIANLFVLAAAVAKTATPADAAREFLILATFCEPVLIAILAVLCAARRLLQRVGYAAALALIGAIVVAISALFAWAAAAFLPFVVARQPFAHVAILALFVTGCILAYFHLRARALAPAIAEARIQALQARIRPHFLYNSINTVISLIRSDPRRAERALEDMADLFRVLMADHRTLAPIREEIELTRQYLALESLRLGERLRVAWKIDTMPGDALLPPLVLQPLVENAVYHGIEPLDAGGEIQVAVGKVDDQVVVSLSNPYPGNSQHTGNRMAILNIRERLQLHFDAEASMASEVRDGLYRVTIRVPYITEAA